MKVPTVAPSSPDLATAARELELLRGALRDLGVGVATVRGGTLHWVNDAFGDALGHPSEALIGAPVETAFGTLAGLASARSLVESGRDFEGGFTTRARDGGLVEVDLRLVPDGDAGPAGYVVVRRLAATSIPPAVPSSSPLALGSLAPPLIPSFTRGSTQMPPASGPLPPLSLIHI